MVEDQVTVGIPCYNSAKTISAVLDGLSEQRKEPSRILCVDDGSHDETVDIVENYSGVDMIEHEQNKGLGSVRNTILEHTKTTYLGMVDDDIRPSEDWLSTLLEALNDTNATLVSGQIIEEISCGADRWRALRTAANPYDEAGVVPQVAGGNFLARTETFREVGGWPEGRWNSEDMVLCQKLQKKNKPIYYEPDAKVTHFEHDTPKSALRRCWRWHLNDPTEVSSMSDIAVRSILHFTKGGYYTAEDIVNQDWWAIPITLRLPIEFIRNDINHVFTKCD